LSITPAQVSVHRSNCAGVLPGYIVGQHTPFVR
jgi:hypothetical protein